MSGQHATHIASAPCMLALLLTMHGCGNSGPAPLERAAATVDTAATSPVLTGNTMGTATMLPEALLGVCDGVEIALQALYAVSPQRHDGEYRSTFHGVERVGCHIEGAGRFSLMSPGVRGPVEGMIAWFAERDFRHDIRYSADSSEGSLVGMRGGDVLCIVYGAWNGGLDAEEEFTTDELDQFTILVECGIDTTAPENGPVF
jgi:hypothetical protein